MKTDDLDIMASYFNTTGKNNSSWISWASILQCTPCILLFHFSIETSREWKRSFQEQSPRGIALAPIREFIEQQGALSSCPSSWSFTLTPSEDIDKGIPFRFHLVTTSQEPPDSNRRNFQEWIVKEWKTFAGLGETMIKLVGASHNVLKPFRCTYSEGHNRVAMSSRHFALHPLLEQRVIAVGRCQSMHQAKHRHQGAEHYQPLSSVQHRQD